MQFQHFYLDEEYQITDCKDRGTQHQNPGPFSELDKIHPSKVTQIAVGEAP